MTKTTRFGTRVPQRLHATKHTSVSDLNQTLYPTKHILDLQSQPECIPGTSICWYTLGLKITTAVTLAAGHTFSAWRRPRLPFPNNPLSLSLSDSDLQDTCLQKQNNKTRRTSQNDKSGTKEMEIRKTAENPNNTARGTSQRKILGMNVIRFSSKNGGAYIVFKSVLRSPGDIQSTSPGVVFIRENKKSNSAVISKNRKRGWYRQYPGTVYW